MKIYISGPMRGYADFNKPAFYKAEFYLRSKYHTAEIVNPAKMDDELGCGEHPQSIYAKRDLLAILDGCTTIYLLNGWEKSKGANAELALARWLELEEIYQTTKSVCAVADELVNGDRGKCYGHPLEDFSKVAGILNALGFKSHRGPLEPHDVPIIMAAVKLSRMTNHPLNNHRDSIIDLCGYMATLEKCLEIENYENNSISNSLS